MCTNDGMVCCWEITADSSLLDIFTTEEIVLVFNKLSQFATMIYFKSPNYKVGLYIDVFANCAIWSGDSKVWKYITETS